MLKRRTSSAAPKPSAPPRALEQDKHACDDDERGPPALRAVESLESILTERPIDEKEARGGVQGGDRSRSLVSHTKRIHRAVANTRAGLFSSLSRGRPPTSALPRLPPSPEEREPHASVAAESAVAGSATDVRSPIEGREGFEIEVLTVLPGEVNLTKWLQEKTEGKGERLAGITAHSAPKHPEIAMHPVNISLGTSDTTDSMRSSRTDDNDNGEVNLTKWLQEQGRGKASE